MREETGTVPTLSLYSPVPREGGPPDHDGRSRFLALGGQVDGLFSGGTPAARAVNEIVTHDCDLYVSRAHREDLRAEEVEEEGEEAEEEEAGHGASQTGSSAPHYLSTVGPLEGVCVCEQETTACYHHTASQYKDRLLIWLTMDTILDGDTISSSVAVSGQRSKFAHVRSIHFCFCAAEHFCSPSPVYHITSLQK